MKIWFAHILSIVMAFHANAQFYLRGQVKDEKNQPLQNVKIILHSNHFVYYSGIEGSFGITTKLLNDSLTLSLDGYDSKTVKVNSDQWQYITLAVLSSDGNRNKPKLISVIKDQRQTSKLEWLINDETYFQLVENEYVMAKDFPFTGLSLIFSL